MVGAFSLASPSRNRHLRIHQSALDWWLSSLPQELMASSPISGGGARGGVGGVPEVGAAF